MADTNPADVQETSKPAKAPARSRVATADYLTRFVVPRFDGDTDLAVDVDGVSLPAKDAAYVVDLAAQYGVHLSVTPEKD